MRLKCTVTDTPAVRGSSNLYPKMCIPELRPAQDTPFQSHQGLRDTCFLHSRLRRLSDVDSD